MIPFATDWICPKCGEEHLSAWGDWKPVYVRGVESDFGTWAATGSEHLRWTCVSCGYCEQMACKDADGSQPEA